MSSPSRLSSLMQRLLDGSGESASAAPLPALPPGPARAGLKRTKLWELEHKHHCPIVGTCLTVEDLISLARRFGFAASLRDEFALHVEAVAHCQTRNPVSEAIQRRLDRKYELKLQQLARIGSEDELLGQWQTDLAGGEVGASLWACCTHKFCQAKVRQVLYGDIHMLSHQVGAGQAADMRRLAALEQENIRLGQEHRQELEKLQQQLAGLRQENAQLKARVREVEGQARDGAVAAERLARYESGEVIAALGQKLEQLQGANDRLVLLAGRAGGLERALEQARESAGKMAAERDRALADRARLELALSALEGCPHGDGDCQGCDGCEEALSSRCILYVGGRAAMIQQYRQFADRLGIRLIHHDGGQEESLSRLPELIHGADAVLCPTDHISHSAYYQVKSHCKRVGKPCLFYQGSGVSSFAVAVTRMSRGEFSLAAGDA